MSTSCIVKRLSPADAEAVAVLRQEALGNHPLAFGASLPDDPKLLVDGIRTRLGSSENSAVFGAFDGVSLIGMVGIVRNDRPKERHKAQLWGMYVTAMNRRTGVGELLLG